MLKVNNKDNYAKAYRLFNHEAWEEPNECTVAYWRKCWGVRNAILRVLTPSDSSEYDFPITLDNINDVIKVFKHFLHKHEWEQEADSIWEWDKWTRHNQAKNLVGLYRLRCWLRSHPEDEAYFYDSY